MAGFSLMHQDLTEACPDTGGNSHCSAAAVASVTGSSGLSKCVLGFREESRTTLGLD